MKHQADKENKQLRLISWKRRGLQESRGLEKSSAAAFDCCSSQRGYRERSRRANTGGIKHSRVVTAVVPVASLAAVKMTDMREEEKNQRGATRGSGGGVALRIKCVSWRWSPGRCWRCYR